MATREVTMPQPSSLDEFTESINLLAYGDPGAGKTALAGTIGEEGLIIALEPGTISAKRLGSKAQQVRCKTYAEFAMILNALRRGTYLNPNTGKRFKWIAIDTLTELQQMMIRHIMEQAHKGNPKRSATLPDMPGHQEWQQTMKRVVHALADLPENVLFLCHAMKEEDEEGETYVLPDIAGKNGTNDPTTMSRYVCGIVHSYGYLKKKNDKTEVRIWIFRPGVHIRAKDRYGVLVPRVEEPNIEAITALIESGVVAPQPQPKEESED